jgi:hypothetical protein
VLQERANLATVGAVAKALVTGNEECDSSRLELEKFILEFNFALSNFGHRISCVTLQRVEGIFLVLSK